MASIGCHPSRPTTMRVFGLGTNTAGLTYKDLGSYWSGCYGDTRAVCLDAWLSRAIFVLLAASTHIDTLSLSRSNYKARAQTPA